MLWEIRSHGVTSQAHYRLLFLVSSIKTAFHPLNPLHSASVAITITKLLNSYSVSTAYKLGKCSQLVLPSACFHSFPGSVNQKGQRFQKVKCILRDPGIKMSWLQGGHPAGSLSSVLIVAHKLCFLL